MMELQTPISREAVAGLKAGDVVYLSGIVYTARDGAHKRALEKKSFPAEIEGGVIFHAGPVVEKKGENWEMVSIGPTTSSRMDSLEPGFLSKFKPSAVIGKGGMDPLPFKENKAVYLALTGGCAASTADKIKKIEDVFWLDLGVPEAVWALRVERLGPLIVAIDSKGKSLYLEDVHRYPQGVEEDHV